MMKTQNYKIILLLRCIFCPAFQAFGKLSAQAEEVGAANLGDLEGFTRDMAKELRRMRKVSFYHRTDHHGLDDAPIDTI